MVAGEANVNLAQVAKSCEDANSLKSHRPGSRRPGPGPGAGAGAGAGAGGRGRGSEESCELDANSLKSGRAGQSTGQGNSCELDANSRKSANASNSRKSPNDRPGFEPTTFGHERTKTLARSIWPAGRCVIGSRLQPTAKNLALHPSLRI